MRLAFSGFFLTQPDTGSGQYTCHLGRELAALLGDRLRVIAPPSPAPPGLRGDVGKVWFEQVGLPMACRGQVDWLLVPYFGPPLVAWCPVAVTVHDLIMLALPEHRGAPLVRAYTCLAGAATRRARLILADSDWTRRDLVRLLGLPHERIRVVPLAQSAACRPVDDPAQLAAVRQKHGLLQDFVLYLGGFDWRKNVPALLRAFRASVGLVDSMVADRRGKDRMEVVLAIAGRLPSRPSALYPDLPGLVRDAGLEPRVRFIGPVDEVDKPALYSAARLFVYPSRYEGFGLPPLEAMACGTPVLCSRATSLPEVTGDAGLAFDPDDEAELARLLRRALADGDLRGELRQRGLARAAQFSWRRTAERVLAALEDSPC